MILLYATLFLFFPFIISLNVLFYRLTVKKALREYIVPKLKEKNLVFAEYRWPGLLSTGNFKDDSFLSIMNKNGSIANSIYADIIYYTTEGQSKRLTAKIDTFFFFVDKVSYSSDF